VLWRAGGEAQMRENPEGVHQRLPSSATVVGQFSPFPEWWVEMVEQLP